MAADKPAETNQAPVTVILQQPNLAAEGARAMAEGKALEMDKCVPGGRYTVNGKTVDANGQPVKDGE